MNRRTFLCGLTLGTLTAPLAVEAQQPARLPRVGYLTFGTQASTEEDVEALRQGLREHGYVEGKTIAIEYRFADGREERLPVLAAELVGLKVDLIFAPGPALPAAMNATKTIPIVFTAIADPVGYGLVPNLARPGGHITGVSYMGVELNPKRLELLKAAVPRLKRVAALANPTHVAYQRLVKELADAAKRLWLELQVVDVREPEALEGAFGVMTKEHVGAAIVIQHGMFLFHQTQIAELALKSRLPTMYETRQFVQAGGLMSYAANRADTFRRAAVHVDKILKGAKPGDLPVEQPTKFELFINLKTAKALGLTIPPSVLARADQVIE
jgi:putative tryptophan/tyrosine transport system substrate-binding protein